jgi:hypothetical protein
MRLRGAVVRAGSSVAVLVASWVALSVFLGLGGCESDGTTPVCNPSGSDCLTQVGDGALTPADGGTGGSD